MSGFGVKDRLRLIDSSDEKSDWTEKYLRQESWRASKRLAAEAVANATLMVSRLVYPGNVLLVFRGELTVQHGTFVFAFGYVVNLQAITHIMGSSELVTPIILVNLEFKVNLISFVSNESVPDSIAVYLLLNAVIIFFLMITTPIEEVFVVILYWSGLISNGLSSIWACR